MYSAFRAVADIHDEAEKYGVKVRDMHIGNLMTRHGRLIMIDIS